MVDSAGEWAGEEELGGRVRERLGKKENKKGSASTAAGIRIVKE
jgi:hypothetical protein